MARIAVVADVHIGCPQRFGGPVKSSINRRGWQVLDTLKRAVKHAEGCDAFVVLGDLFDTTRPSPQLIAEVQRIFSEALSRPILLMGNHDLVSVQDGDHAMGPLRPVAQVIEEPSTVRVGGSTLIMVPYRPCQAGRRAEEALVALADQFHGPDSILCMHAGIADAETSGFLQGSSNSIWVEDLLEQISDRGIPFAVSGDWHERHVWRFAGGQKIMQVGALCPTGFDNPGFDDYGFMAIWDTDKREGESISIPGPRFVKLTSEEEFDALLGMVAEESCVYVKWIAPPDEIARAVERVRGAKEDNLIVDGGVIPDEQEAQECARVAAKAAASAETLQEAVASYVAELSLTEGVSRERVLMRTREYLK